jgi:hypothetical protein
LVELTEETDPIPKPDSRLSTDFSSLVNNSEFADVQIVVDNKTILAHKAILCIVSSSFVVPKKLTD